MTIDILLATFNSERFLADQLDSILAQEDRDWRLLIRDGGSSDGTIPILEEYRRRNPDRIFLLPGGRLRPKRTSRRLWRLPMRS